MKSLIFIASVIFANQAVAQGLRTVEVKLKPNFAGPLQLAVDFAPTDTVNPDEAERASISTLLKKLVTPEYFPEIDGVKVPFELSTRSNLQVIASVSPNLSKENVLSEQNEGKVMGLPEEETVDALRAVDAFKATQGWGLFRRPAVLMRKEAIQVARLFKEVEDSRAAPQKKTIRRILSGERMSGKSTLLLQGLSMGFLREWFVINLPEGKESNRRSRRYMTDHH
ncbi:MAG: hypothetical protein EOP04_09335 [Proteobacteria bacterium]|nr:MAG: hypothetical protein EOP04_09335 [Pseudomonadota bacterium]